MINHIYLKIKKPQQNKKNPKPNHNLKLYNSC